jgi:hypothetical protein
MGIYLCIGCPIHSIHPHGGMMTYTQFNEFNDIHKYMALHHKIILFLGEGHHKIKQTAAKIQGVHIDYPYLDGGGATSEVDYIIDLQYFQDLCPYCHNIDYDHVCQNLDRCDHSNPSTKPDDDIVTPLAEYMKRPRKFKRLNRTACSLHRN